MNSSTEPRTAVVILSLEEAETLYALLRRDVADHHAHARNIMPDDMPEARVLRDVDSIIDKLMTA